MGTKVVSPFAAQLAELEAEHGGRLVSVEVAGKLHAFRAPTLDEYEQSQGQIAKLRESGKPHQPAFRELAQVTCVTDIEALKQAFQTYPALPGALADALAELSGGTIEVTVKKG